jgi:hypothetical protein
LGFLRRGSRLAAGESLSSAALEAEQDCAEPVALGRHRCFGEPAERDGGPQAAQVIG